MSTHDECFPKWPKINGAQIIYPNSVDDGGKIFKKEFKGNNDEIERMMRFMSSTFYGNKVVILEGREVECINSIFDNLFNDDLSNHGIGKVEAVTKHARSDKDHDEPGGGVDDILKMVSLYKQLGIEVACFIDVDFLLNPSKKEAVSKLYKEMSAGKESGGDWGLLTLEGWKALSIDGITKRFGPEAKAIIIKKGLKEAFDNLVKVMNESGIYFFELGDFEANFSDEFIEQCLNKDKDKINKEKMAFEIKYRAETESPEKFKEILNEGAEDSLKKNFEDIKKFFKPAEGVVIVEGVPTPKSTSE